MRTPNAEAVDGVVEHLRKFWDPSMRRELLAARQELHRRLQPARAARAGAARRRPAMIDRRRSRDRFCAAAPAPASAAATSRWKNSAASRSSNTFAERLLPQVGRIVISCNRNADRYARWGDATVSDHQPGLGPLAGILAGMNATTSDYLFICPGDAPFMPDDLVSQLATALCRHDAEVAIPNDGTRRQPLFMLVLRSLAPALRAYIDGGGRAVHGFIEQRCCVEADLASQADAFVNVNDRADMQAAAAMHRSDQRNE